MSKSVPVRHEHIVQLFDCCETRAEAVATFIADALASSHPVLAVVKSRHWVSIELELFRLGVRVPNAIASGELTVLDAADTLAAISKDEHVDAERFRSHVGTLLARLAATANRPPCVYGEMVELYAETGDFAGALELEELWNGLARDHAFRLLCGYSSAHFGPEPATAALHAICCAHTSVQTLATDPLGEWLASAAWPKGREDPAGRM